MWSMFNATPKYIGLMHMYCTNREQ